MTQARATRNPERSVRRTSRSHEPSSTKRWGDSRAGDLVNAALEADQGIAKADAARLFQRVAATSPQPPGKVRSELIPDSSWKRAGKTLGPQASQTTARLGYILEFAERVWGNEADAIGWLNSPHPELQGATPFSLLRTEAGGRAAEALLAALEFGFPV